MPPDREELLAVGRVARAHGVGGEVAVQPLSEVEERFQPGSVLLLGPDAERRLTVRSARPHRNRLLVRFEEISDRDEAEGLRGSLLLVPVSEVPAAPEGSYWTHQIVGLEILTEGGRSLGRVREVLHNPANDVWVTDAEVLVPATRGVVLRVEPQEGRVVVRDLPGLEG